MKGLRRRPRRFAMQTSPSTLILPRKPNHWPVSSDFCEEKIRTRERPIRTASRLPFQIKIPFPESPVHQIPASKIKRLKAPGMTNQETAESRRIGRKTVAKGLKSNLNSICLSVLDGRLPVKCPQYFFGHFRNPCPFGSVDELGGPTMFVRKGSKFVTKYF